MLSLQRNNLHKTSRRFCSTWLCIMNQNYYFVCIHSDCSSNCHEVALCHNSVLFNTMCDLITGKINATYSVNISCTPSVLGQSLFLPAQLVISPQVWIPTVSACPKGTQASTTNDTCIPCGFGTYDFDGLNCVPCPPGALLTIHNLLCPSFLQFSITVVQFKYT